MNLTESAIAELIDEGWDDEAVYVRGLASALQAIYDDARYVFDGNHGTPESAFVAGQCRWCGAPPPDEKHDHDVACPAAKAIYALDAPNL